VSSPGAAGRESPGSESWSRQRKADAPVVSPELALVDPELARRATAELPDFDLYEDSLERPVERPPEPLRARPRGRRRLSLLIAACATAAVIAAAVLVVENRDGTSQVAPQRSAKASASTTGAASSDGAKQRNPKKPTPQIVRTFSWAKVRGARSYEFQLFRGAKRIFTARPSQPRLRLPVAWRDGSRLLRLDPGAYRWLVRPVLGSKRRPRFGPTIVSARLVVAR
jgi:hypothetical protein